MLTMRRLQAPAGHEPGIDQHQHRAFCPAIRETSTYAQMCAAAQPLCGRVETVWVQPQSFDDGRQPESRSSQLTGGPQSIDWGNRVVNIYLRFADSTAVPGSLGICHPGSSPRGWIEWRATDAQRAMHPPGRETTRDGVLGAQSARAGAAAGAGTSGERILLAALRAQSAYALSPCLSLSLSLSVSRSLALSLSLRLLSHALVCALAVTQQREVRISRTCTSL